MSCPATITLGGVTAEVWHDAPGLRKGTSLIGPGPWRQIQYRVATWDEADLFIDGLFDRITYSGGPGQVISYPAPHQYPGNAKLVALHAEAQAVGHPRPGGSLVSCDYALVAVTYGVPDFDIFGIDTTNSFGSQPAPFATDSVHGYSASYSLEAGTMVEVDENDEPTDTVIPRRVEFHVPHQEYTRVLMGVPYFYDALLRSLCGTLNHATFFGMPRGTLRFDTFDIERERATDGSYVQRYTLRFTWRPHDWNMVPVGPPIEWKVGDDGAGRRLYAYNNFGPLAAGVFAP